MSSKQTPSQIDHDDVQQLLPWFVTGQLAPDQLAKVKDHLRHCAECSADTRWEDALRKAAPPSPPALDPEAALARLMPRLENRKSAAPASKRSWLFGNCWMPWALAGQSMLLAGLVFQLSQEDAAPYRALGNEQPGQSGNVVVVFDADVRLGQMQSIMQASGARIVDGPTVTGAYMLSVPPARQSAAIAELKAQAGVRLAEPLTYRGAP